MLPFANINVPGPNAFSGVFDFVVTFVLDGLTAGVTNGVENIAVFVTTKTKDC